MGGALAVTVTDSIACTLCESLSVTLKVKSAFVAEQLAETLAVRLPSAATLRESMATPLTVADESSLICTTKEFSASSTSLTTAINVAEDEPFLAMLTL
jgi:hypothetical protein